jgi:hypothetical protein
MPWRLHTDVNEEWRERAEAFTLRIVGVCFLVLALYVSYEAVSSLAYHELPARSIPGILLALASLIVMPLFARAKRRVAQGIDSEALLPTRSRRSFAPTSRLISWAGCCSMPCWAGGGLILWQPW